MMHVFNTEINEMRRNWLIFYSTGWFNLLGL